MEVSEKVVPEWITTELLLKAIRNYKNDDSIEIKDYFLKSEFSEHIASVMIQCKIDFKSSESECQSLNVVIKAKPITDGLKPIVCEGPLFENEIRMYSRTLPAFNQLFERFGMSVDLAPDIVYATDDPFPIIILKDLTGDGYFAPRFPFDDLEQSKLIIQRLAQFHAASFYLSETKEMDLHCYNYSVYKNEALIYGLYSSAMKVFQEVLETWDGYQEYIPKIDEFMKHIGEIGRLSQRANEPSSGYNVLNHGDFHVRNTLVKLNAEKRLQQFCFIDYQLSVYCSPAVDINYFLGMFKRDENGDVPFEDAVVFYHQEFVKTLNTFEFSKSIPSLIDLNIEMIRHGRTNVLMMIVFIPWAFIDWKTAKLEDVMGTDKSDEKAKNFKKSLYNHPICKIVLQRMLKSFVHKGWL